jgi:hypothetical protein
MQGVSPSIKIASPWSRKVDFLVVGKILEEGRKKCLKYWKIERYRLVVSFFCPIFVVQNERETPLTFCNVNERKKPRARFTTDDGATIFFNITTKV